MKYMHTTIESARTALETMVSDAKADGFNADDDIDVVYGLMLNLEMDCSPKIRKELWQVELGIESPYQVTVAEAIVNEVKPVNERALAIAKANRVKALDRRKR